MVGAKQWEVCMAVLLSQLYQCHLCLAPAPVLCLLARGILHSFRKQHFQFSRLLSFIPTGLQDGVLGDHPQGYPWTSIPAKSKVGITAMISHPCPQHACDDCSQGCLYDGMLTPAWFMP